MIMDLSACQKRVIREAASRSLGTYKPKVFAGVCRWLVPKLCLDLKTLVHELGLVQSVNLNHYIRYSFQNSQLTERIPKDPRSLIVVIPSFIFATELEIG